MPVKNPIDCFKKYGVKDLSNQLQKRIEEGANPYEAAREIILAEHRRLHDTVNDIRTVGKLKKEPYIEPKDISQQLKKLKEKPSVSVQMPEEVKKPEVVEPKTAETSADKKSLNLPNEKTEVTTITERRISERPVDETTNLQPTNKQGVAEVVYGNSAFTEREQGGKSKKDLGGGVVDNTDSPNSIILSISEIDKLRSQNQTDLVTGNAIELENDLLKNGIKEPLTIIYYPNDGKAILSDGHNRLDVSKDIGVKKLPVVIIEKYTESPNWAKDFTPPAETTTPTAPQAEAAETTVSDAEALPEAAKQAETKVADSAKQLADKVRSLKIDLSKLGDGGLQSNPLGLPVAVWNGAMDIVAKTIEAGGQVADAVKRGLNYIQKNHRGQWDKKGFNDQVLKELGVRGITVNGQDLIVKDVEPEFAETINGFYSDIEQSILDVSPTDKGTPQAWLKKIGTGEEAKWTGVTDWLNSLPKDQKLSRKELLDWLKENRIQVVEVVKGKIKSQKLTKVKVEPFVFNVVDESGRVVKEGVSEQSANDIIDAAYNGDPTKYSEYQLGGEKENYKEVLVTLPNKIKSVPFWKLAEGESRNSNGDLIAVKINGEWIDKDEAKIKYGVDYDTINNEPEYKFKSNHFDEPNILVHLRMNTRTDADGNKVLFLEEIQSDWGQKGKKEGFKTSEREVELKRLQDEASKWGKKAEQLEDELDYQYRTKKQDQERRSDLRNRDAEFNRVAVEYQEAERKAFEARRAFDLFQVENRGEVPQAPFVTETPSWTKLGLKVALKEAVKQGADKIAWSTGTQQFDRWGSEEIHWSTIVKPKGFEIVVKDDAKRPIVRGSRIKLLSSNDGSQDQKAEVKRIAEKWNLKPEDLEVVPSRGKWTLAINEQTDAQAFQGNEEALRINKLEESDISVGTKEELRNAIKRNLSRERNDAEIDKLTNRIWDRMQKEESGTSLPRKEGMESFYGSPSEGKLGIVGEVAKSLFKQEPGTIEIDASPEFSKKQFVVEYAPNEPMGTTWLVKDESGNVVGRSKSKSGAEQLKEIFDDRKKQTQKINVQYSIDITPELRQEAESGLPLFKDIKGRGKAIADALRKGKIKMGGLQSNIAGIPAALWNAAIDTIALAIEGGATLAQAVQKAIKKHNLDKQKGFNQKEFISKLEQASGEKLLEEPPPGEPPPTDTGKTDGGETGGKKKSTLNRLYEAKNMPERAKEAFEKEGFEYVPASQEEAAAIAAATIDELGIDEAVREAAAGRFNGGVNAMIFGEALNRLADNENDAGQWADIAIQWDKYNRVRGQDIAAINFFYKHSPLGVILKENAERKNQFNEWAKGKDQSWKEYFDELKSNPEFADLLNKTVQEDLKKERKSARATRIEKVRGVFAKAKAKFKKEGGGTYGTIIPPHVIETVLEAMELAYEAGEAVVKIVDDAIKSISNKTGSDNWDKEKFRKEWEAILSEKGGKAVLTEKELQEKVINKFKKKIKGLTDDQKDEVIRKSYLKLIQNNALDYDEFKEIIARVTGRGEMTDEQKAKLKEMVAKTNAAGEAAKVAQTERTPEALQRFYAAEIEAGRAARDLRDIFRQKPDILRRLTSIMQLSTLGAVSLVANVTYNIWNQAALRFPIGVMNDTFDRVWGGIARMMGKPSTQEYNVWSTQGEFWNKMGQGLKESFEQIGTGLNRQDYTQKELYGQQMRPFKALRELYAYAKGKRPLTRAEWWDKLIEGTAGIPAELVARFLNVGDKPMRFAAAGAQAKAFTKALGLKDIDERLFIEFPQEEAYRYYKGQGLSDEAAQQRADYVAQAIKKEGERATLQQDNLFTNIIDAAAGQIPGGKDSGSAALAKTLLISPYIKIPTNVFWSYYNLLNPEIGILQSLTYAGLAKKAKNKGDITKSQLLNREARYWMAHAILGMALRAVVIAMVQAGRVTPPPDEEESKKERDAIFYFDKPGTIEAFGMKIQSKWWGPLGPLANSIARKYYDATPEQRENQDEFWNIVFGGMERDALMELENGVFANTSSLFQSLSTGDWSRYGINTLNLFANIIQPATIAQINRAALDEVPTSKGDSFLDRLNQNFAQRSTLYRRLFDVELYKKQDIFGRPIPKGGNLLSRMFGISKANPQLEMRPLYDDFLRTGDSGFLPPAVPSIMNGTKLNMQQQQKLNEYVGEERLRLLRPYVSGNAKFPVIEKDYIELEDDVKKGRLQNIFEKGRKKGVDKFYKDYPELKPNKSLPKPEEKILELTDKLIK